MIIEFLMLFCVIVIGAVHADRIEMMSATIHRLTKLVELLHSRVSQLSAEKEKE